MSRVVASDPDGRDHVYSTGDKIAIHFSQPTNLAGYTTASPLVWNNVGSTRPTQGQEILGTASNLYNLRKELLNTDQKTFTEEEWSAFGVQDVRENSYILVGVNYYQPAPFVCDEGADLSSSTAPTERFCCSKDVCDAPVLSKQEISNLFVFSQLLGDNYEGRWLSKGTIFEITILNADGSTAAEAAGPPYVGGFVVWTIATNGRYLRDADGKSEPSEMMSPVLEGAFGPELIKVISMTASDPDDSDPAYDVGDAITIRFSQKTNKGELPDRKVSRADIDGLLQFNVPLAEDYRGDWLTCDTLRITMVNISDIPPPALGLLKVSVLPGGKLRNWPPAAASRYGHFYIS